jgi:hypothetical protein
MPSILKIASDSGCRVMEKIGAEEIQKRIQVEGRK